MTDTAALRAAYRAGKRSSLTSADAGEAAARWSRRHCPPHPVAEMCPLEHAWWDGYAWDCNPEPEYLRD